VGIDPGHNPYAVMSDAPIASKLAEDDFVDLTEVHRWTHSQWPPPPGLAHRLTHA
jgi:hypothetical protein